MSCSTCGGNNVKKRNNNNSIVITTNNILPMRTYIEQLGWKYIGMCGCTDNKAVFINDSIEGWKIEIAPMGLRMEIWQMFNGIDGKKRGIGGPQNYEQVYDYWINKSGDNIKIKTNE